jgi:phosphatidylglycerol:prolipoprotein diacylglycerol transferase
MITRVGCYLFGCDFGQPLAATAPDFLKKLGSFPHWPEGTLDNNARGAPAWVHHHNQNLIPDDAPYSLPVHPTQIYESLVGAGLLVLLLVARGRQKFRGQIFLLFTFAYGVCRYLLEVLRDDTSAGRSRRPCPSTSLSRSGSRCSPWGVRGGFSKMIREPDDPEGDAGPRVRAALVLYVGLKPESFASW